MRLSALLLFLAASPGTAASSFPLRFAGTGCDRATGICGDIHLTAYEDGRIYERTSGEWGTYTWNRATKAFTGRFTGSMRIEMSGTKRPHVDCVAGEWGSRAFPGIGGSLEFCLE